MTVPIAERTLTLSSRNPVVGAHRVYGNPVLPGMAYLDLIHQICAAHGLDFRSHALERLRIHRPLVVADAVHGATVRVRMFRPDASRYAIVIDDAATAADDGRAYASAELVQRDALPDGANALALAPLGEPAADARRSEMAALYARCRDTGLVHDAYLRAHGEISVDADALLARLELDAAARPDASRFMLHPTLLDAAAIASRAAADQTTGADDLYLPLVIESFVADAPLGEACVVRIPRDAVAVRGEIVTMTLEFFSPEGAPLARMRGFTAKRVRDPHAFPPRAGQDADPAPAAIATAAAAQQAAPRASGHDESGPAGAPSEVVARLRAMIAQKLRVELDEVALDKGYYELGLESVDLLDLVAAASRLLGTELSPTLMFEYPTLGELDDYARREFGAGTGGAPASPAGAARPAAPASARGYRFVAEEAFLQDHLVLGKPALMGVTHPCAALDALAADDPAAFPLRLSQVRLEGGPITLEPGEGVELSVLTSGTEAAAHAFEVRFARDGQTEPQLCCRGEFVRGAAFEPARHDPSALLAGLTRLSSAAIDAWYARIPAFSVGPMLRTVREAWHGADGLLVSRVALGAGPRAGGRERYVFDPLLLNSCFFVAPADQAEAPAPMFVPLMVERIELARALPDEVLLVNRLRTRRDDYLAFDVEILALDGERLGRIVNASIRAVADPDAFANARFGAPAAVPPPAARRELPREAAGVRHDEPIAIIGVAGRYPGAATLEQFWRNLAGGTDSVIEIPAERWDHARHFDPDKDAPGKTYSKWGGFIDDVDRFDPYYFGITPREAELMDPQERLFLQCATHAIEDAGYTREGLARCAPAQDGKSASVGVYVGVMYQEYQLYGAERLAGGDPVALSGSAATIANRVSYFGNFSGPSLAIDTMCSSSLTALSLACRALERGDCGVALVGGVNLSLHPNKYLMLAQGRFASSRGRCEAFGKGGDGYVPGEGVGAVLLKPLARALADGDTVHAVVRAAEVNHGGRSAGYSVPGVRAQAAVVAQAYRRGGVDPRRVAYIEAHGTGTSLGDPIEIAALSSVFGASGDTGFCAIGSVKSNIGHAESAAGVAGLTKLLLQLRHRQLAPSLHAEETNPAIPFERSPFVVQRGLADWPAPRDGGPRLAGLSSFGAGGSNAHVVIEEAPAPAPRGAAPREAVAVPLSAGSWPQLRDLSRALALRLAGWLDETPANAGDEARGWRLVDTAFTLQTGRDTQRYRLGIVADSLERLVERLNAFAALDGFEDAALAPLAAQGIHAGDARRGGGLGELAAADVALLVGSWLDEGRTAELLRFWCRGGALDWRRVQAGRAGGLAAARRVSLPGYPFVRERYWVPAPRAGRPAGPEAVGLAGAPRAAVDDGRGPMNATMDATAAADGAGPAASTPARGAPRGTAFALLAAALGEISGFPAERIDPEADFEALGLDSVMITRLNQRIAQWTGEIDAALLYKYKSLDTLAAHLDTRLVAPTEPAPVPVPDARVAPSLPADPIAAATPAAPGAPAADPIDDAIAIVGISGRYPQADTLDAFWANLVAGVDCVSEIPRERFDYREIYRPGEKGRTDSIYCKWGGFLSDVAQFDAPFFNLTAQDAALTDPQERLFLEAAWRCLEGAGYLGPRWQQVPREIGVFAGVSFNNYQLIGADALAERAPFYPAGSQTFSVANRVSFFFNFTGPSIAIDTACSSSLYALHLACESLRRGEAQAALAGGVNLTLHPSKYLTLCASSFAASDGRCHAFASGGDGYVPGEGVGVVLLKRHADAVRDGDPVLALIRGTGVSHDGKTQGFTVPNPVSQTKAIRAALARSAVEADSIGYIEAHGTGTALGDPIEIQGLADAYPVRPGAPRALGSVKASIGHGEAAAGIAQLTKTVLQLRHGTIAPTLLHGPLNPDIGFARVGFEVPTQAVPWPVLERAGRVLPRRAGISSFGAGGVNVHVIVEEAPLAASAGESSAGSVAGAGRRGAVLPLSAPSAAQLHAAVRELADCLAGEAGGAWPIEVLAFTLQHRRPAFRQRLALVASDTADALRQLRDWLARPDAAGGEGPYRGDSLDGPGAGLAAPDPDDLPGSARAWAAGARFDWPGAAAAGVLPAGPWVPLPGVPLAPKRHWIADLLKPAAMSAPPQAASPASGHSHDARDAHASLDGWLMETVWEPVTDVAREPVPQRIALWCDDARTLRRWSQAWSRPMLLVEPQPDGGFGEALSRQFESDAADCFVFVQAHARLSDRDAVLDGAAFQATLAARAARLVEWVARAIDAAAHRKGLRLALVNLSDQGEIDPIQETLSKYFSFLRFEVPELASIVIDVDALDARSLARVGAELHASQADTRVRWIEGERRCARLRPLAADRHAARGFDPSGTMVVTGGFGGIGFAVLGGLIERGVRSLIVIGRKPDTAALRHPELAEPTTIRAWADHLARTRGVSLHYLQSSLDDEATLARALDALRPRLAEPIRGVFHLAGVSTDAIPVRQTRAATLLEVAGPKLVGAYLLDRLTAGDELRYFFLFSSISSVDGMQGNGLSAYGAANAGLLALAAARRAAGRPAQAVQWTDWDGAGMAVAHNHRAFFDALGMSMLTPEQGVRLLERIAAADIGEAIVFDADWRKYASVNRAVQLLPVFAHYAHHARPTGAPGAPLAPAGGAASAGDSVALLIAELGALLGQDDLHPDQSFADVGLNSINSLAFFSGLSERLAFEILPSAIFRHPTIRELAAFIDARRGAAPATAVRETPRAAAPALATAAAGAAPIAIVGMAGQFPQAEDLPAFWARLLNGEDGITHYPAARGALLGAADEDFAALHGGYLDDIDLFDPAAFHISPREARLMDPQQRLLMLNAHRAIADAGIRGEAGFARTGVFIAQYASQYMRFANDYQRDNALFIATGNAGSIAANRLSYHYGFEGPSMVLDTACSSTLVALDIACQYLRSGQIDQALVGGVSLNLDPRQTRLLQDAGMLSPTGRCHTFDAGADGYVPGEGAAMIVLRRLDDARAHRERDPGRRIYAVVAGSAVNQDGRSNGMTAPNGLAQEAVIRAAFERAGLAPSR
ncbi:beta-ketoacyl synthase N-terminal-like domain-containing protein, partial [Burkholderia alba]|uniref:beta-ketoacyl synthase N-terminal-like domain-containing protein n=1 Tax=Burkholderia alba TaxID=2683677 RepID=UPI002B053907